MSFSNSLFMPIPWHQLSLFYVSPDIFQIDNIRMHGEKNAFLMTIKCKHTTPLCWRIMMIFDKFEMNNNNKRQHVNVKSSQTNAKRSAHAWMPFPNDVWFVIELLTILCQISHSVLKNSSVSGPNWLFLFSFIFGSHTFFSCEFCFLFHFKFFSK